MSRGYIPLYPELTTVYFSKKDAWERHRSTWGTAIYEDPIQGATHKDMNKLKHVMNTAKLPPCSLKGHRHFGAPSEPMSVLN